MSGRPFFDLEWTLGHLDDVWEAIVQHVQLVAIPVALGFAIALLLGILASRRPAIIGPLTGFTGVLYTIPSLAAFAILIPITGLSLLTAIIPLTAYTLLILFRNIVAGFQSVPNDVVEAAEGMGYTDGQRLWRIELPLAVPLMIAGIRLAVVTTIGLATVAAILGDQFGGLGQFITEGIQTSFPTKSILGAGLSVVFAFAADFLFVRLERLVTPWSRARASAA
jgi:osmoprotectant transport system permease protein